MPFIRNFYDYYSYFFGQVTFNFQNYLYFSKCPFNLLFNLKKLDSFNQHPFILPKTLFLYESKFSHLNQDIFLFSYILFFLLFIK